MGKRSTSALQKTTDNAQLTNTKEGEDKVMKNTTFDKAKIKSEIKENVRRLYRKDLDEASNQEVYQAVSETEQVHVFDLHQNPNDQCIVGKHIRPVLTDVFRSIEEKAEQELRNTTLRDCMDRMQGEIERSGDQ